MYRIRALKAYLFVLPSLTGFSILYLIPFIWGIRYSVSLSGFDNTFVGLKNYESVLLSGAFRLALKNSAIFMSIAIPLIMTLSFFLALAVYEFKPPKWVYLFIVLPIAVPSATVVGFFRKLIGSGAFSLMNSDFAMLGVILIFIWKNTGYNLIIYLAGLMQLDGTVIEASKIDGAGYLQRLRHIIIPMCTPVTALVGIVTIINSFKVFKDVYILQGSYPNPQIYMLQHFMNNKFKDLQYEKLTSAAYLFAAIIFIGAFLLFRMDRSYSRKVGES
ncbi:MAG TPA: sugar ABC transporter permease [Clostridia bacterium]|nr:sugar ABC transporter permease [Clostridia bacterium]